MKSHSVITISFSGLILAMAAFSSGAASPGNYRQPEGNADQALEAEAATTVGDALRLAEIHISRGLENKERTSPGKHFSLVSECFARAYFLLQQQKAEIMQKDAWFKFQTARSDRKTTLKILKEALELNPQNPIACYKVAYILWLNYYDTCAYTEKPQTQKVLPDGSIALLEPIRYKYSPDRDNSELDQAQRLLQKAVALDDAFADAYHLLGKICAFKNEWEKAVDYYYLFLKYRDRMQAQLYFDHSGQKEIKIQLAKDFISRHDPQKLKELP